jgi:hypothetical protein
MLFKYNSPYIAGPLNDCLWSWNASEIGGIISEELLSA